ncbi:MAG: ABC transporter ATP-binding protein [Cardiobacteriaceae bacterium]|nr:ABC transporter ATP-binding protein [Cardiobacteriaceae bacterium]
MTNALLTVKNLHVQHNQHTLLNIEHWQLPRGQFTVIIGPNGAGKTTLLNALAGGNKNSDSHIYHSNISFKNISAATLAAQRAVLSQNPTIAFPLDIKTLVQLGREPYRHSQWSQYDSAVCDWAIHNQDLDNLKNRNCQHLSGGEQHRAHIARILTQLLPEPDADLHNKWLLLDEPTNHLDIHHQYRFLATLKSLQKRGLTILAILHDPALALNHADRLLLLKNGNIQGEYTPQELIHNQYLDALYHIQMGCYTCPHTAHYYCVPQLPN